LAATQDVTVGGAPPGKPMLDLQGFYPRNSQIHVGDTVHFQWGGFHTVAILPNGSSPNAVVHLTGNTYAAENDAAGNPFWWGGHAPELQFNPLVLIPSASSVFDGTAQVNSGTPPPGVPPPPVTPFSYDVTFTAPGTYQIVCELHPYMKGTVTVAAAGAPILSSATQDKIGERQMKKAARHAIVLDRALSHHGGHHGHHGGGDGGNANARNVIAGAGAKNFSLLKFYPQTVTVRAGGKVTWRWFGFNEIHTVTIGPDNVLGDLDEELIGGPPNFILDPVGALPTDPPGSPVTHDDTSHGNGLTGSGVLPDKPGPSSFTVQFTKPGLYHYICLIHDGMQGWVNVVPAGHHHDS
jgi:plastocyanin